ncbi:hypothetical protein PUNSTDRAFT_67050 [Punctularia strigosozonata HHB-11173 SS5]|uniref:uncharacterized protein n=1 Tax=Punctularia strigosozonata (strain HHB-11173) TaxID=741275 RepID=UPI000441827B|nr:uncharacterized protein PUNSTDRAFT_67050 [Punctularia strigosozonata HHB-11173 SS5]EIN10095.1 hypothetical protein PUNSTDRAFT_67050 [Punctularia strigosozonata HHB-11173 SS5]
MRLLCILLASSVLRSQAGSVALGGSCSSSGNHLDPLTHKFMSQCDEKTFCPGENSTCTSKLCRRDEFPFGYAAAETLPSLCPNDQFCPDDGSGCRPLLSVGDLCDFGRDEQCSSSSTWQDLVSPFNFNGSVCLGNVCMYANMSVGQRCILEKATYTDAGFDGQPYARDIMRHNCRTLFLYCDEAHLQCFPSKDFKDQCTDHQECISHTCVHGACAVSASAPGSSRWWKYALSVLLVLSVMVSTSAVLVMANKRARIRQYREMRMYYYEQTR